MQFPLYCTLCAFFRILESDFHVNFASISDLAVPATSGRCRLVFPRLSQSTVPGGTHHTGGYIPGIQRDRKQSVWGYTPQRQKDGKIGITGSRPYYAGVYKEKKIRRKKGRKRKYNVYLIVISGATNVINSLYGIAPLHERYTSLFFLREFNVRRHRRAEPITNQIGTKT